MTCYVPKIPKILHYILDLTELYTEFPRAFNLSKFLY